MGWSCRVLRGTRSHCISPLPMHALQFSFTPPFSSPQMSRAPSSFKPAYITAFCQKCFPLLPPPTHILVDGCSAHVPRAFTSQFPLALCPPEATVPTKILDTLHYCCWCGRPTICLNVYRVETRAALFMDNSSTNNPGMT